MSVLTLENVYKSFNSVHAVQDLSLDLPPGIIFGLLGPNGAGKTTTIRMILDIIIPDKGKILLFDLPNSQKSRDLVGYLPEERGLYRKMKVGEQLTFLAEMKEIKPSKSKEKIEYWLDRFELSEWKDKKIEELSKGMQQKIQFIATVIHEPKLIILDEPFTGLDPVNTELIKNVMLEQKDRGATIIFSTHLMDQVEKLCDSICLINEGKAVLDGELKNIKKNFRRNSVLMQFEGDGKFLNNSSLVQKFNEVDNHLEIFPVEGKKVRDILQAALDEGDITRFEVMEPSLNEIFIETVTKKKE
ncbi:ATP-binding cassette domain-containing protein [candidate division KSB1 bacterium]|nr:ATP-binding cassette domain-containing protein [candidate division KSB1 bacterium]